MQEIVLTEDNPIERNNMKYRWTMKELKEFSDQRFIVAILEERRSELNPYSSLNERIGRAIVAVKESDFSDSGSLFERR